MSWVKFSGAVLLTSAALVVALFATGAVLVGNAMASSVHAAAQMHGADGARTHTLPPELASLKDIPAAERFAHFKGVQVNLTDKDGNPLEITVTPGVASSVSDTSITVAGNDGASHTYALDGQTFKGSDALTTGQDVIVVTLGNTSTARAVIGASPANWHRG